MKKNSLLSNIWKNRYIYLLILPVVIWIAIFCYGPMYGVLMAFKDYKARLGVLGSEWVGLKHFRRLFITPYAINSIKNTLIISFQRLIFQFPIPIILALLITEMPGKKVKKFFQTVYTLPHFLSWVIVSAILTVILSDQGLVNAIIQTLGFEKVNILGSTSLFRPLMHITNNWKEMGWSAIIYMAALSGIDTTLYDAAKVDGASRLQQIWHVTLPGISSTIIVLLILEIGNMMNGGFEQIFSMRNDVVDSVASILDIYVYDITFTKTPDYGFSTAVGLFKSVINFLLLLVANKVSGWITGQKLFE